MPIADDWDIDFVDKKISHTQFKDKLAGGSDSSVAEVTDVTVLAASGITTGDYFLLYSATDKTGYYVWYNKDGGGGDPAPAGKTAIPVVITTGDANTVVATATRDAINTTAPADFTATASTNVVTVTNDAKGSTTDAKDSSGGTATGFTFAVTTQGVGKTVWSVNAFYSFLQDEFDEVRILSENIPISAQTPTEYSIINEWFIDEESIKYLKGGAIKTSGWNGQIQQLVLDGTYVGVVAADIGKQVKDDGTNAGALLFADNTASRQRWWFRSTSTVANNSVMTIADTGTGAGDANGASVSGENLYANIFTLGGIETAPRPVTYIFQSGSPIDGWWERGDASAHIDVLIRVKEAGTEINSGIITVFIRQYGDLYDTFEIDLTAGGRNAVPLASQKDTGNNTLGEGYLLYDGETANFTAGKIVTGQTSGATAEIIALQDDGTTGYLTLGNVVGTFQNNETIKDDNTPAGTALSNGTIGDTILNYDAESVGFTTLGQIVTGALSTAKRALRGAQDNGTTGRLNLQVSDVTLPAHFKVYNDNELITGATNGSADANGVSVTNASGFADVKVWFMNVEVDFASLNGLVNEGDLVTGATSGATAIFLGEKDANTLQLANLDGTTTTFTAGEQLQKDGSNYYVLANPTNQTPAYLINQSFQLQSANPYSVIVDCAGRKVAQVYEWLKYITREKANVSQINRQIMYPLISSVVVEQDGEEYLAARVSPDTAYVQSKASPLATFSGGKLFGAQGVWIQNTHSDDIQAFQVVDANGTIQNPPNLQTVKVSGVVSGDRVTVLRTTGTNVVNKAVFTAASGNNTGNTTFVVNQAIPADTPSSGIIRIINIADTTNARERRYSYTSWATSTFSGITKTFSVAEVTDVTVLAGSGISGGDYFNLYSATDVTAYYIWYKVDGSGTDPAPGGKTGILVEIASTNANTVVATTTRDAINTTAPADFTATAAGAVVTITNDATGLTTDATDSSGGTATGFTFAVTFQGGGATAGLDRNYTATNDTAYVPYIDTTAADIEVSQTIIYITNRTVVTWVRKYEGTSTIIPFETTGTLTSSGYQTTAIRTTDPIAT